MNLLHFGCVILGLALSTGLNAQGGELDAAFGNSGLVTFGVEPGESDAGKDIGLQSDGKIIVGAATDGGGSDYGGFFLFRLFPDGSLDTSFANGGMRMFSSFNYGWDLVKLIVASNDRIIVVGQQAYGVAAVWRLLPDGSWDPTFSDDGTITLDPVATTFEFFDADLLPDGALILCGYQYTSFYSHLLAKITSEGQFDEDFGSGGYSFGSVDDPTAHLKLVRVLDDGHLLCATNPGGTVLRRYSSDGAVDLTFGDQGVLPIVDGQSTRDMLVETDQGITLLCGLTQVRRFNAVMEPDPSFGEAGVAVIDSISGVRDIERRPDGKYVIAGVRLFRACVAQLNGNGTPDTQFSVNGVVLIPSSVNTYSAAAVVVQNDGKMITTGQVEATEDEFDVCVNRWISDDPSGVEAGSDQYDLWSIAPVPCSRADELWVRGPTANAPVRLSILDSSGRPILTSTIVAPTEGRGFPVRLPDSLAPGLYLVRVTSGNSRYTGKLIID